MNSADHYLLQDPLEIHEDTLKWEIRDICVNQGEGCVDFFLDGFLGYSLVFEKHIATILPPRSFPFYALNIEYRRRLDLFLFAIGNYFSIDRYLCYLPDLWDTGEMASESLVHEMRFEELLQHFKSSTDDVPELLLQIEEVHGWPLEIIKNGYCILSLADLDGGKT